VPEFHWSALLEGGIADTGESREAGAAKPAAKKAKKAGKAIASTAALKQTRTHAAFVHTHTKRYQTVDPVTRICVRTCDEMWRGKCARKRVKADMHTSVVKWHTGCPHDRRGTGKIYELGGR